MSIGNDVVSSDFLKVLLALKDNIMRDLHCNDIGIVVSTSGNECVCKLLSNPDIKISCTKINNIITDKDDVVFIAYTDINSKHNAKQLSDQKDLRNQTIGNKHAYENAVIVLNYSKQGSGEGVTVDSAFSTTSTNALQNKVITNRFNQVESRLINVDSALSATSTNPVQNKVLYNPVQFAESERQKSKNLCCLKNESETVAGVTMIYDSINQTIELNGTSTGDINIMSNIRNILPIISNSLGKTYSFTILKESGNFSENFGAYLGSLDSDIWSDRFTLWVDKVNTISSRTFTVSTNHTYDTLFVYLLKGTVVNNLKLKVQLEEGSVATDYQPYNGQITHNGDPAVEFAESERQKSKNLFKSNFWNKSSNIYEVNGITFTYNPNDYSITINGTATARALCYLNPDALSNIKIGTYTFSGFSKKTDYSVYIQSYNEVDGKYPVLLYSDSDFITLTFNIMPKFTDLYISVDAGIVVDNLVLKLQAEEGSVATDYQPYNGAIVHEKEIEITIGDATLNTDVISSGEVSWVKQGKLVVVSFSDVKFKGTISHQNLYFSGLPKKAIKAQTFLLHQTNAQGGSSLRCMMPKDSTQIINWYQDTTLDPNAQYYGQLTYITDEN